MRVNPLLNFLKALMPFGCLLLKPMYEFNIPHRNAKRTFPCTPAHSATNSGDFSALQLSNAKSIRPRTSFRRFSSSEGDSSGTMTPECLNSSKTEGYSYPMTVPITVWRGKSSFRRTSIRELTPAKEIRIAREEWLYRERHKTIELG